MYVLAFLFTNPIVLLAFVSISFIPLRVYYRSGLLIYLPQGNSQQTPNLTMQAILGVDMLVCFADVQNLTFTRVKFHVPGSFPSL